MKKYMMMIGLMSLIGVNHGEASDAMTMSSLDLSAKKRSLPNSLKARGPNTKSQKINADEKENITTESSSDASIEIDEKESAMIESSLDSSAADPFDIDEEKINEFIAKTAIPYWKLKKEELKDSEEISKAFQSLIDELNAEDKIDRIIAYIDNQAFHPGLLIKKGLEDANDVDSFLNALECVVFNNIQ